MIIHSIVPAEIIFNNQDNSGASFIEVIFRGERLEVMPLSNNQFVINRLLSTSLKSFLNPSFNPGSIINGNEIIFDN